MKKIDGFTFLELAVVISIIAIVAIVAFPNYSAVRNANRVYSQAREAQLDLRYAGRLAVSQKTDVLIEFDNDSGRYSIFRYDVQDGSEVKSEVKDSNVKNRVQMLASPSAIRIREDGVLLDEDRFVLEDPPEIRFWIGIDDYEFKVGRFGEVEEE